MIKEIEKTYEQIESKILNHETFQAAKDYSKTKEKLETYWEIGKLLKDVNVKYGKGVIKKYSERLTLKFGKKYTTSLLYKIKQFYNIIKKVPTLSGKLTWSHWYEMLPFYDIDENLKTNNENKTVGIIICKEDNKYIIKYCSDDRIIFRKYELVNKGGKYELLQ